MDNSFPCKLLDSNFIPIAPSGNMTVCATYPASCFAVIISSSLSLITFTFESLTNGNLIVMVTESLVSVKEYTFPWKKQKQGLNRQKFQRHDLLTFECPGVPFSLIQQICTELDRNQTVYVLKSFSCHNVSYRPC